MPTLCELNPSNKPTFPIILLPIAEIVWILSLTVRPNRYRPLFLIPIASISIWSLACSCMRTGRVGINTGLSARMVIIAMCAIVDILLTNPQEQYGKVDHKKEEDLDAQDSNLRSKNNLSSNGHTSNGTPHHRGRGTITSAPFLARLKWAAAFWFNPRGIGLPNEPTDVYPPKPSPSTNRRHFFQRQLWAFLLFYPWLDISFTLAHLYDARRRWLVEQGNYGPLNPWRLLSLSFGVNVWVMMSMEQMVMSLIGVGSGLSSPQVWPDWFHSPTEAFTLKRFWGKFWHQLYRRHFLLLSDFLAHRVLRLPRSSGKAAGYFKAFLAFAMSGIMHFCGDALTIQSLSKPGSLQFFCLQPLGLIIEDLMITLWRRFGRQSRNPPSTAFKLLGFVWVLIWLGYTVAFWVDPQLDGGYLDDVSIGWPSVILGLWKGQWQWPVDNRWVWTEM